MTIGILKLHFHLSCLSYLQIYLFLHFSAVFFLLLLEVVGGDVLSVFLSLVFGELRLHPHIFFQQLFSHAVYVLNLTQFGIQVNFQKAYLVCVFSDQFLVFRTFFRNTVDEVFLVLLLPTQLIICQLNLSQFVLQKLDSVT